jgi:hypothetical protein
MQFRHPESYRILSDGRILQDPMGSGVGYVDVGVRLYMYKFDPMKKVWWSWATVHSPQCGGVRFREVST